MTEENPINYLAADEAELSARLAATRLRNLLRINSEFSLVSGVIGLAASGWVADLLGTDAVGVVRLLSGALVAFACVVFWASGTTTAVLRAASRIISVNDLAWVAGTIVVIAVGWLSPVGAFVMGAMDLVVLALGLAQMRALNHLSEAMGHTDVELNESPPVEVRKVSKDLSSSPDELWPVMIDHGLYAELALNLKHAEALTPHGPGFERSCSDPLGRAWSETCTLWDPGHRFDVDVDTGADDYPYPAQLLQGSWQVTPNGSTGSTVQILFAIQPEPGWLGRFSMPAMHVSLGPVVRRIINGWQRASEQPAAVATDGATR